MSPTSFNIYLLCAILVGFIFPLYSLVSGKKVKHLLTEFPEKKTLIYRMTVIQLIILMLMALIPLWHGGEPPEVFGLGFSRQPLSMIGLVMIALLWLILLLRFKLTDSMAQKVMKANSELQFLMPTRKQEFKLSIVVSFAAGICEEIIYRGFLLWWLMSFMEVIPAFLLTNIPFALAHLSTTGKKNTIVVFILALGFSGIFLWTQSLWLPILLHTLLDIYSMTLSYKAFSYPKLGQVNSKETELEILEKG